MNKTIINDADIAIIGSGPGGYVAALYAAQNGAKVCLIEKSHVGGTCLNVGCIPTKSLVASSSIVNKCANSTQYGIDISGSVVPNWTSILERANKVSSTIRKGVEGLINNRSIELVQGEATIIDRNTISVNDKSIVTAKHIIIATGSVPAMPNQLSIDHEKILISDDILTLKSLPKSIAIIGEGVIACEFAFIFNSLGVEVTVIGMESRPLPTLDLDISKVVVREMKKKKIKFLGSTFVQGIKKQPDDVCIIGDDDTALLNAERALVCIGRTPNTSNLGIENLGIKLNERNGILVNEYCQTNIPNIYAIGDVNANCMLAHSASKQGKVTINHISKKPDNEPMDYESIPWCIFTEPEIGVVGKTEDQARQAGFNIKVGKFDIRGIGKAQVLGQLSGLVKVVIDADTDTVLGVHIIGCNATELIQHATLVVYKKMKANDLMEQVFSHPTISESIQEAFDDAYDQAIHKLLKTG
tara:strand:+ start:254 stop:1666 length:1413 start_codon:yes stop_codon:yes gene_type:complete